MTAVRESETTPGGTSAGPAWGPSPLAERVRVVARAAADAAAEVDRDGRFPHEALTAMREQGLLGALVPVADGGLGLSLGELAEVVASVGRGCSSAGMVLAMHQIQVACLLRHGHTTALRALVREVAARQLLLASATSEVGVGGDVRTSRCAVETDGGRFRLEKQASVISYGQYADAVLATARRNPEAPPGDQVLVVCRAPGLELEPVGGWDVLGFRGTVSLGFRLTAADDLALICPDSYGDISTHTMLPVSHLLWSSLWSGMAEEALSRAARFVRIAARRSPGAPPPSALRLAELAVIQQQLRDLVAAGLARFAAFGDDRVASGSIGAAASLNALKVGASTLLVQVVGGALQICGMAGYRDTGEFSIGRLLRDAHGALLMVNNDRILANNAQLLLAHRDADPHAAGPTAP